MQLCLHYLRSQSVSTEPHFVETHLAHDFLTSIRRLNMHDNCLRSCSTNHHICSLHFVFLLGGKYLSCCDILYDFQKLRQTKSSHCNLRVIGKMKNRRTFHSFHIDPAGGHKFLRHKMYRLQIVLVAPNCGGKRLFTDSPRTDTRWESFPRKGRNSSRACKDSWSDTGASFLRSLPTKAEKRTSYPLKVLLAFLRAAIVAGHLAGGYYFRSKKYRVRILRL